MSKITDQQNRTLQSMLDKANARPIHRRLLTDTLMEKGAITTNLEVLWNHLVRRCAEVDEELARKARALITAEPEGYKRAHILTTANAILDRISFSSEDSRWLLDRVGPQYLQTLAGLLPEQRKLLFGIAQRNEKILGDLLDLDQQHSVVTLGRLLNYIYVLERQGINAWQALFDEQSLTFSLPRLATILHYTAAFVHNDQNIIMRTNVAIPWHRVPAPIQVRLKDESMPAFATAQRSFDRYVRSMVVDLSTERTIADIAWMHPWRSAFQTSGEGHVGFHDAIHRLKGYKLLALAAEQGAKWVNMVLYEGASYDAAVVKDLGNVARNLGVGFRLINVVVGSEGLSVPEDAIQRILFEVAPSDGRRKRKDSEEIVSDDASDEPEEATPTVTLSQLLADAEDAGSEYYQWVENLHNARFDRTLDVKIDRKLHQKGVRQLRDVIGQFLDSAEELEATAVLPALHSLLECRLSNRFRSLTEFSSLLDGIEREAEGCDSSVDERYSSLVEHGLCEVECLEGLIHPDARMNIARQLSESIPSELSSTPVTDLFIAHSEPLIMRMRALARR